MSEATDGGSSSLGQVLTLPSTFGHYVLLRELARQPTRTIYLATAQKLGSFQRLCVVKVVSKELSGQKRFEEQFARAARRLVHIDHRNIAQVFDSGHTDRLLYEAEEFVCGCTLEELIIAASERDKAIPVDLAVLIVVDMLRGLYHAWRQLGPDGEPLRLWHGRLSPKRVMISVQGEVKIVGWDREWELPEHDGERTGSVFTAPELIHGELGEPTADVFSAAQLALSLLQVGQPSSDDPDVFEEIKPGLGQLIRTALAPDPAARPRDVGGLLRPLRAALHRLNPRCGPPELADYLFGALGGVLERRVARAKRLLKSQVAVDPKIATSPLLTRTLLLEADEKVKARAMDKVVGEDAPLTGILSGTKYRILRPIGEGGMGTVYAAEHIDLEKVFALKILREKKAKQGTSVVEGLRREARATSKLGHPNIVSVTDFGEIPDGRVFFVMEYLEGQSLGELLEEQSTLRQERLISILIQVCEGLAAAHEKGVIHRDIKPDNVFLVPNRDGSETVKLLDFGVAVPAGSQRTKGTHIAGTPYYMSPEMIRMKALDGRSDLYSLGVFAYEALSGERPFGPAPVLQLLRSHLKEEPKPLLAFQGVNAIHPELAAIVHKALKKDPEQRFRDAQEMADALRDVLGLLRDLRDNEPSFSVSFDSENVQREIEDTWAEAFEQLAQPRASTPDETAPSAPRRRSRRGLAAAFSLFVLALAAIGLSFYISDDGFSGHLGGGSASMMSQAVTKLAPPDASVVRNVDEAPIVDDGGHPVSDGGHATSVGDSDVDVLVFDGGESGGDDDPRRDHRVLRLSRFKQYLSAAEQALGSGRFDLAEEEFNKALSLNPRGADAINGLGRVAFQRGNYSKAEELARRALERNPESARFRLDLGAALFRQGRVREAEVLFRQVLADDPENRVARRYLEAVQQRR